MARPSVAVGLLVLVVAAGCLTGNPASTAETSTPTESFDGREIADRPHERVENPWEAAPIEVVVENPAGMERNVHPQVMKALTYWEQESAAPYTPEFRLVDHTDSPEIRVQVVHTIEDCGVHTEGVALGCAPRVPAKTDLDEPVTVKVRAGHTPEMTLTILKHEFGHTLGLEHGDEPESVMRGQLGDGVPESVIDADDRRYPWPTEDLRVAFVGDVQRDERERVRAALQYYERGADGAVPSPPSFELVGTAEDAHVVVDLRESVEECDIVGPEESCAHWDGPNVDDDPEPEYYTRARIVVSDGDRVGWHVGYWLGHSLWVSDVPTPFRPGSKPAPDSW